LPLPVQSGSGFAVRGRRPEFVYTIMTPIETRDGIYPDSTFCVYNLLRRRFNHQYTYVFNRRTPFDLETANRGRCADCMEYSHAMNNRQQRRIFCGRRNPSELIGAGTISKVEINFKSDMNRGFEGVTHSLAEYPVNVSFCAGQAIKVACSIRVL